MKAKSKIIVSAILAIALCVSLIAGTTFALFTSEDSINIAVTAGNVEVEANLSLVSADLTNGGTAKVEGKELTLSNIVPGDSATVKITLTNKSTVAISYRVKVAISGPLAQALKIDGVQNGRSEWKKLGPKEVIANGIDLTVSFPEAADNNDYMGASGSISVTVEAVQGNATVEDVYVSTAEELLEKLAAKTEAGEYQYQVIGLNEGTFDLTDNTVDGIRKGLLIDRPVTLIGSGKNTVIKVGTDKVANAISGQAYVYVRSSDVTISDLTIESVQTADTTQAKAWNQFADTVKISYTKDKTSPANVTLNDVEVIGTTGNGINVHGAENVTFNNVSVSGTMAKCAVAVAESNNVTFNNCSLAEGAWKSVGLMYNATTQTHGSSVTFNGGMVGVVYTEHPDEATDVNTVKGLEDREAVTFSHDGIWQTVYAPVVKINGDNYATLEEAIVAMDDGAVITLGSGTFIFPANNAAANKTIEIVGAGTEATVIDRTAVTGTSTAGLNLTVKNATIKGVNANYKGIQHDKSETYIDCVIEDQVFLYAETVHFVNCVFNQSDSNCYNVWTYGAQEVTFDNCIFNTARKAVLIYNEGGADAAATIATFNNCTFNSTWMGDAADMKAAVEVHTEKFIDTGKKFTVTLNQCTYTENTFSALVLDNNPGCGCADITVVK